MKKGYLQISFAWLFAIIVGAFILFTAIYGSTKLIKTEQSVSDAKVGEEIGILLNPLETGFESAKTTSISLPVESKVFNKCDATGAFGSQKISVSQESFGKWTETNLEASVENKYIFSNSELQGKKFYIFSKPFEFPFKVADLIYMTEVNTKYCFINSPEKIKSELGLLKQGNILLDNCTEDSIRVCFNSFSGCDVKIDTNLGSIEKREGRVYFREDSLMYAGIFSDKETYECQLKRLMRRIAKLCEIYKQKESIISRANCNSNLGLESLNNICTNFQSSINLNSAGIIADKIGDENDYAQCKLW